MRPSLLPGLLSATQRNADRGASATRLFEVGRRYFSDGERATVGIVLAGDKTPRSWHSGKAAGRSEEHTSDLQSLMRISYAVFCLKKKKDAFSERVEVYHCHCSMTSYLQNREIHILW